MRRVLTFLTAIALLLVSLGVGVFTADLPFWRRALQLPLPAGGAYLPVATIGVDGARGAAFPTAVSPGIDALVIEESVNRARAAGSRALLVMHRGELAVERYFQADDARTLLPAGLVARPLTAMAVGVALSERRIVSLGLEDGEHAEVRAGVNAGEPVIVMGQAGLPDGAMIAIAKPEPEK